MKETIEPRFNGSIKEIKCGLCGKILLEYEDFQIYSLVESGHSSNLTYNHLIYDCEKTIIL